MQKLFSTRFLWLENSKNSFRKSQNLFSMVNRSFARPEPCSRWGNKSLSRIPVTVFGSQNSVLRGCSPFHRQFQHQFCSQNLQILQRFYSAVLCRASSAFSLARSTRSGPERFATQHILQPFEHEFTQEKHEFEQNEWERCFWGWPKGMRWN